MKRLSNRREAGGHRHMLVLALLAKGPETGPMLYRRYNAVAEHNSVRPLAHPSNIHDLLNQMASRRRPLVTSCRTVVRGEERDAYAATQHGQRLLASYIGLLIAEGDLPHP